MGSIIIGSSYYLPEAVCTNDELANIYPDWNSSKILSKTGIETRHVVKDECVSDLAINAAEKLFSEFDVDRKEVDFLMVCTQSPDYLLPTTACLVQDRLQLSTTCGAMDFNLGCSGFIYGLVLAKGLITSGVAKNIILVTADLYTRHIHPMDKSTRTIFGDAATATLIQKSNEEHLGIPVLGTDGKGANNLIIPAGGMRLNCSPETAIEETDESGNTRSKNNLYMNGPEIFNFTVQRIPPMISDTLKKNNVVLQDIDLVVFHQANKFMMDYLRNKIGVPKEKFYEYLKGVGNTVSSTIPIALAEAVKEGRLKRGMKVLLAGFGVGYSWGGIFVEW